MAISVFNTVVIIETVLLLVILVQVLQLIGDRIAGSRSVFGLWISIAIFAGLTLLPFAFMGGDKQPNVIRVGIVAGAMQEIIKVAQVEAKNRYGLTLEPVIFDDYTLPNIALNDGKIQANLFQHLPYLQAQIADRGFKLVAIGKTFIYPMGFYSKKISHLSQLKPKAVVAISNDPSNQARALLVLQKAGLIGLRANVSATRVNLNDIVRNPKQLHFVTLDAAQLAHALSDATLVAINNDFLPAVGLGLQDAILREGDDSPYANVIVVKSSNQHALWAKDLVQIMHSKAVIEAVQQAYSNGGALRAWSEKAQTKHSLT